MAVLPIQTAITNEARKRAFSGIEGYRVKIDTNSHYLVLFIIKSGRYFEIQEKSIPICTLFM